MQIHQDKEQLPYRKCVGIVVFNDRQQVWAGRRLMEKHDELTGATKLWQLPQGGIDSKEEPIDAAYRELYEETGIKSVKLLAQNRDWLTYDLPDELIGLALKGKYRGQKQKWFAFKFTGKEEEIAINPPPDGNSPEFDQWKWVELETLPMIVVPFKQGVYEKVVAEFRHIVA